MPAIGFFFAAGRVVRGAGNESTADCRLKLCSTYLRPFLNRQLLVQDSQPSLVLTSCQPRCRRVHLFHHLVVTSCSPNQLDVRLPTKGRPHRSTHNSLVVIRENPFWTITPRDRYVGSKKYAPSSSSIHIVLTHMFVCMNGRAPLERTSLRVPWVFIKSRLFYLRY